MAAVVQRGERVWLWCPGCEDLHSITVPMWTWDGDTERPTISPSILVRYDVSPPNQHLSTVCHSFVRAGVWEFLSDCTHSLAGQSVDMATVKPEWPWV